MLANATHGDSINFPASRHRSCGPALLWRQSMLPNKYQRIRDFLNQRNSQSYRAEQLMAAIFEHRIGDFQNMTTLPKALRAELANQFGPSILDITPVAESVSSQT